MFGVADAGTFRDVGEGSVTVVVVEIVGRALEAARSALNVDAHVSAGVARSEGVEVIQVDIDIVRDEKVVPTIAVVVAEGCASSPHGIAGEAGAFVTSVKVPSPLLR